MTVVLSDAAAAAPRADISAATLTASGETERMMPRLPLASVALAALVLTVLAVAAWEVQMRRLGLRAEDSDDGVSHWAVERKALAAGPADGIALIGDSRQLFDSDLQVWEDMTGRRPVQLALPGTNAGPFLEDLANDEHFRGLAVLGFTEFTYFIPQARLLTKALDYTRTQSPAQRFGHQVFLLISPWFAFLDAEYRMPTLLRRVQITDRPGVLGPYPFPWKLSESFAQRQTVLWPRIVTDDRLREHARMVWGGLFRGEPLPERAIAPVIEATRRSVQRIRARGGEVLLLKPPSDGDVRQAELRVMPRANVWDRLVRETGVIGIHWEDYADMRGLEVPEWSHLTGASATRFTRAYVREAIAQLPWLKTHMAAWRTQ